MGDLYLSPRNGEKTSRSNRIPTNVPLVSPGAAVAPLVLLLRHFPIVTLGNPPGESPCTAPDFGSLAVTSLVVEWGPSHMLRDFLPAHIYGADSALLLHPPR